MDCDLVAALRFRGVESVTALDADLIGRADEDQFGFRDRTWVRPLHVQRLRFYRLHTRWAVVNREHAGLILALQQRFSVGEQLHRILRLRASMTAASMRNRAEFLSNWD